MKNKNLFLFLLLFFSITCYSQVDQDALKCRTSEMNRQMLETNPQAKKEYLKHEEFTKSYVDALKKKENANALTASPTYIIPVVFHVFGSNFSGLSVTQAKIEQALLKLNEDFQGLNSDYNTVDYQFNSIKQSLNIEFRLATIDPYGSPTTGVKFYGTVNGFGNGGSYDSQIQQYAWDNYKYMNVYIQSDLYNDGSTTNSGVAWYPNTSMSNSNTARVVYNGRYIYGNTDAEFASVLSHEFGHWLNLIHTFEGGCTSTNDQVSDTPAENASTSGYGCSPATNCYGQYINYENYMGYNGASGCYKMFTQGQVNRMLAALQHPARQPLWQESNLVATGTSNGGGTTVAAPSGLTASVVSSSQIALTWNDNSSNETGFSIERAVNSGSYSQIATVGSNTTSYTNTSLTANTNYSYRVRAYAGNTYSSYSNSVTATPGGGTSSYCSISGNNSYEYIKNVGLGTFTYSSGAGSGGYENNTSTTINLAPGANVSVSLTPGFSSSAYNEYWGIWIDYNKNNAFEASEQVISGLSGTGIVNGSFTVSSSASGSTRLRVVMKYNGAPSACGAIGDGEAEDYTVDFSGSSNPVTLSTPGNIRSAGTYATGFYAAWDYVSGATEYDVQLYNGAWQTQGTSSTYYLWIPKQASTSSYTFRVRAKNNSGVSAWSSSFSVTLPAAGPLDVTGQSLFEFYPNPSSGYIHFSVNESTDAPEITIYNSKGILVDTMINVQSYSTNHLQPGIYLIKFKNKDAQETKRLVIE